MTTVSIPLSRGKFALIDEEDLPRIGNRPWQAEMRGDTLYATQRVCRKGYTKRIFLHRVVMDAPEGVQVDHVSGDTLDCRKRNLRFATTAQNTRNRRKSNGAQPYKGIYQTPSGRYGARVCFQGKRHKSRLFDTPEGAAHAYDALAREYFGEFAAPNFA